jgi:hypothetical protein
MTGDAKPPCGMIHCGCAAERNADVHDGLGVIPRDEFHGHVALAGAQPTLLSQTDPAARGGCELVCEGLW